MDTRSSEGPSSAADPASVVGGTGDSGRPGPQSSGRRFWWIFAAGWTAYGGLYGSAAALEGMSLGRALVAALGGTGAPLIPALVLAVRRRDLLRSDRTLPRTLVLHAMLGVGFALAVTVLSLVFEWSLGLEPPAEYFKGPLLAVALFVNGLLLYAVFTGFLTWSVSLDRFQESQALMAQASMLRAEAEAKSLRAQLNPHFIFNALHSMILLVRADPDRAERAIEDVAALIRYGSDLQRRGIDTVSIAVEMEMARRYLALESLRLGDRLRVEWSVDPGLEDAALPALTLQTLLENAVKHGISPLEEGGAVEISIRRSNGDILLCVADDGAGSDQASVAASGEGGLQLLRRRFSAHFADEASFEWRTKPGLGFTARVRLPIRPAGTYNLDAWVGGPRSLPLGPDREGTAMRR